MKFNFTRALQASAVLLRYNKGRMAYLRLLKLLYIAEREWLAEHGEPLVGDQYVAMDYGPVMSRVYDLITGKTAQAGLWANHVQRAGYEIELVNDPGSGKLSRAIVDKLTEVSERFHGMDDFRLSMFTHGFKEWNDHYREGTSTRIPWQELLIAQGRPEMIAIAEREAAENSVIDEIFGPER